MSKKPPLPLLPDHQMFADATEALKRYHEAQESGMPAEQVERLRLVVESAFQAVMDYHLYTLGHQPLIRH